ncbi:hypothetical protein nbrc107696_30210 [Gordonia spumicola]|uniref:Aromatic ring-opening dioxygenase LigB n=1 Tax=Gordonia spumicola TaxID=589161 RepID=A0A7I9VB80_9ACTN|nr:hypothetical protein [Gordonia spumicola]GEE02575.1 hypothetical protein nbrc107696_30210 [Gordonia spumicola]
MLAEVAIVPSAPLLVPELAGPDAVETDVVRAAVDAAGRSLGASADRWIAIGADGRARRFAAYGVDVPVSVSRTGDDVPLPLSMLIAAWLRGRTAPDATVDAHLVADDASPAEAAERGRRLAEIIDADPEPVGLLVVGDGATALSASAPGGGDRPSAHEVQAVIDTAFAAADAEALNALDPRVCDAEGVGGRAPWQVLAGLAAGRTFTPTVRFVGAPFGVGYTVATWTPR